MFVSWYVFKLCIFVLRMFLYLYVDVLQAFYVEVFCLYHFFIDIVLLIVTRPHDFLY